MLRRRFVANTAAMAPAGGGTALAWATSSIIDGITRTNGDTTATRNSTDSGNVRTFWVNIKYPDAAKTYVVLRFGTCSNDTQVGLGPTNTSQNRSGSPGMGGTGSNSVIYTGGFGLGGNGFYFNGSLVALEFGVGFSAQEIICAFDGPNRKYYFYSPPYGEWGGSTTTHDDPLTNTGGWVCGGSGPLGDMYCGVQLLNLSDAVTILPSGWVNADIITRIAGLNSAGWSLLA